MKLKIVKATIINGKPAQVGKVFDADVMQRRDVSLLLSNKQAELFTEAPKKGTQGKGKSPEKVEPIEETSDK